MLSTSFIVSASPVLTSPFYENTQASRRHNEPDEGVEDVYNLSSSSGSRRVKRSFSVGRTSDLAISTQCRSVSQSRESLAGGGSHSSPYQSPIQRRPLPSIPSQPPPSPSPYQRSLLSDIYRLVNKKVNCVDVRYYFVVLPKTETTNTTINFHLRQKITVSREGGAEFLLLSTVLRNRPRRGQPINWSCSSLDCVLRRKTEKS